ncbi:MAG: hypothetical protein ACTSRG_13305 [Candidatus Helarchaeota archaeon]
MKILKQIGFICIAIGVGLGLYQSYLLISAYLYDDLSIDVLIGYIRPYLISIMLIGFFLIVFGGVLENHISKKNEPEIDNVHNRKSRRKKTYIASVIIGCLFIIPLLILIMLYPGMYVPHTIRILVFFLSIATIVWLAICLPLYVDKINKDTLEINLFGLHIHETFLGILFIITGFIFVMHHIIPFDFIFGSYYLIIGAFLMGRDIEDLRQFKIIERIK